MNFKRSLALISAGFIMSVYSPGAVVVCSTDAGGIRTCVTLAGPTWTCEVFGGDPRIECYDIVLAATPVPGAGILQGSHPSLNTSGILALADSMAFVGRADGQNFAVRLNVEQPLLIEAATLPNAADLIAVGPVVTGVQFVGRTIELPPFVGEFDAGTVTSGDFAMTFALLYPATLAVEQFRVVPVNYSDLEFFVLGPACPGDFNGDGAVDLSDLAVLLSNFGVAGVTYADGDVDSDGTVSLNDLAIVLGSFGSPC